VEGGGEGNERKYTKHLETSLAHSTVGSRGSEDSPIILRNGCVLGGKLASLVMKGTQPKGYGELWVRQVGGRGTRMDSRVVWCDGQAIEQVQKPQGQRGGPTRRRCGQLL
jgi:hypothetical protein